MQFLFLMVILFFSSVKHRANPDITFDNENFQATMKSVKIVSLENLYIHVCTVF